MDDFYLYVNQNWLDNTTIPNDMSRWSQFNILNEKTKEQIIILLNKIEDSNKIKILWNQLQNIFSENIVSMKVIKVITDYINDSYDTTKLFKRIMKLDLKFGLNNVINYYVDSHYKNSSLNILHLTSGGLSLPDREYYMESKESIHSSYKEFINKYASDADIILRIEKELATSTHTMVEKGTPELTNNIFTLEKFISEYPKLSFIKKIFRKANVNINKNNIINVTNPKYFSIVNHMIERISLDDWKKYFIYKVLLEFHLFRGKEYYEIYFNFFKKKLLGVQQMKPMWKISYDILDSMIGCVIGKLYIEKHFSEESKKYVENMVTNIKNEMKYYLNNNDMMETTTKMNAINKLDKMGLKIGYPDSYDNCFANNFMKLNIRKENNLLDNIFIIKGNKITYELTRIYKPVNRKLWNASAHHVNAYYSPNNNEIIFPAGILQEPFFSLKQNTAYNYGAIGTVIGHEISHAFDDYGSKYDADGNYNNWWSENDLVRYNEKIKKIEEQYNMYKINGKLTLGENIADIMGVTLSFNAYKKLGLDMNDKDFFISYAILWRCKTTEKDAENRKLTDPHSPPNMRVNVVLSNIKTFYDTFNIKANKDMKENIL